VPRILDYDAEGGTRKRVQVIRHDDGEVEIVLPGRITFHSALLVLLAVAYAAICIGLALHPAWGEPRLIARTCCAALAVPALLGATLFLRQSLLPARLFICRGELDVELPWLIGNSNQRYRLGRFGDATVEHFPLHRRRDTPYLLLHYREGGVERILEKVAYRLSDLEAVASVLREKLPVISSSPGNPGEVG
jgi:hypothetical protein